MKYSFKKWYTQHIVFPMVSNRIIHIKWNVKIKTIVYLFLTSYAHITVLLFLIYESPPETEGTEWTVCQWDQVCQGSLPSHRFIPWRNTVHNIRLWSYWETYTYSFLFSLYTFTCFLLLLTVLLFIDHGVSTQLLDAKVLLISQSRCMSRNVYGNRMDDSMMCAGYMQGKIDSCQVLTYCNFL